MEYSPLERREGESDYEYHKRLVNGKLSDKTLADFDYSEISGKIYGKEYSSDVARRMMYGSKRTIDIIDNASYLSVDNDDLREDIDVRLIELQKERQKFFDQRNAYAKVLRDRSREEELNEIIRQAILDGDLPELKPEESSFRTSGNDLIVSLNDIHYGASIDNYWTKYNPEICAEMMGRYAQDVIEVGEHEHSENCYVMCNGDMISGNIHHSIAVTNKENVIRQVTGVSELISEFLYALSRHFRKVIFASVAGNHSRITPSKENEVPGERMDNLVEWYLKARLQNVENIEFGGERIDETMYLIDVRGKTYCGVHGEYEPSDGKVQTLQTMAGRPLYAIMSGHLHHNEVGEVQGIKTVMAGSFQGMDDFCVKKRIYGKPQQMICVCDKNGIRCFYDINL